jgi:hypothetical protein
LRYRKLTAQRVASTDVQGAVMSWPFGLYSKGMPDLVVRELEIGTRAAAYEDDESCGLDGALLELRFLVGVRRAAGPDAA